MTLIDIDLVNTCMTGNIDKVRALVEQGADIHVYNDLAIGEACYYGHLELVKGLIDQGADLYGEFAALGRACEGGHLNIIEFLIEERGVNINANSGYALASASMEQDEEIINYLLERGADPEVVFQRKDICDRNKEFLRECLINKLKSTKKIERKKRRASQMEFICPEESPDSFAIGLAKRVVNHQYDEFEEMHRDFIKFAKCVYGDKFPDAQFTQIIGESGCMPRA